MKLQLLILAMLLLVSATLGLAQTVVPQADRDYEEKEELTRLERGIFFMRLAPRGLAGKKVMGGLVPEPETVLADDYTGVDPRGEVITRKQELENYWNPHRNFPHRLRMHEINVQISGDTAIVRLAAELGNTADQEVFPAGGYRATSVYSRREGKWLLVSTHWTKVQAGLSQDEQ